MTQYARIKSCNRGRCRYLTKGKWYKVLCTDLTLEYQHQIVDDDGDKIRVREESSQHVGGTYNWEIVDGKVLYYGHSIVGGWMCSRSSDGEVGIDGCKGCKHLLDTDEENQTITCGYPQNKEKTMDVKEETMNGYEALAKAKNGETICCEHGGLSFTKTDELISADEGGHVWSGSLSEGGWYIKVDRVSVTIGGESFEISKESAESFKESINRVKL